MAVKVYPSTISKTTVYRTPVDKPQTTIPKLEPGYEYGELLPSGEIVPRGMTPSSPASGSSIPTTSTTTSTRRSGGGGGGGRLPGVPTAPTLPFLEPSTPSTPQFTPLRPTIPGVPTDRARSGGASYSHSQYGTFLPSGLRGSMQGLTTQDFLRMEQIRLQSERSINLVTKPISTITQLYAEESAKETQAGLGYGGRRRRTFGGRKDLLPYESRGTIVSDTEKLTPQQLGELPYGGGGQALSEQLTSEAQLEVNIFVEGESRRAVERQQDLVDRGIISAEQANANLERDFKDIEQRANQLVEQKISLGESQFALGRERVKGKEAAELAVVSGLLSAPLTFGAGYLSATSSVAASLGRGYGLYALGKGTYQSGKELYKGFTTGDFSRFPGMAIGLGISTLTFGAGYKLGRAVQQPRVIEAIERSQVDTKKVTSDIDVMVSKYGLSKEGALELKSLLDKGYKVQLVESKLTAASASDRKYLPKITSYSIQQIGRDGNVISTFGVGTYSSSYRGKVVSEPAINSAISKLEGSTQTTLTRVFRGRDVLKSGDKKVVSEETQSIDYSTITSRNRVGLKKQTYEGDFTSRLIYKGKYRPGEPLPVGKSLGGKTTEAQVTKLLISRGRSKSLGITKGEFSGVDFIYKMGTNKIGLSTGGLIGGGRAIRGTGTATTIPVSKGGSRLYRNIPTEQNTIFPSKPTKSYIGKPSKPSLSLDEGNPLVGQKTDAFSQSIYGYGYGINYGGGYRESLVSFGVETVTKAPSPVLGFTSPQDSRQKRFGVTRPSVSITPRTISGTTELITGGNIPTTKVSDISILGGRGGSKSSQIPVVIPIQRINQVQTQKIVPRVIQVPITKGRGYITPPNIREPKIPPPISIPKSFDEDSFSRYTTGFVPQVKLGGRFITIGKPVTKGKALTVGAAFTDVSLARTFRIVPTRVKVKKTKDVLPENLFKFRTFKQKRGVRSPLESTFIERAAFSLEPSEQRIIQPLARAAQRRRGSRFF